MNRRTFLETSAAGAGAVFFGGPITTDSGSSLHAAAGTPAWPPVRIHKVFLGGKDGWPDPELDEEAELIRLETFLAQSEASLGDVRFVGERRWTKTPEEIAALVSRLHEADGVLIFNSGAVLESRLEPLLNTGLQTMMFSQMYSGHDWSKVCKMQKEGKKVVLLATSDFGEITKLGALMRVAPRLRRTRVICIGNQWGVTLRPDLREKIGIETVTVDMNRVRGIYSELKTKTVSEEADDWMRKAQKVVEPTKEDILKAARVYLALRQIIQEEKAQAITINCLGGFALDELGYPCLGFSKLNDEVIPAACEADMDSLLTMLIFKYAFGIPGFITDPVFDTATNTVVHAHCLSATRMKGPDGPRCPYIIRNHAERHKGACLQVKHFVGESMTCAKLFNLDYLLVSTGTITGNPDNNRACRTKMATRVADARRMLDNWGCGVAKGGMVEHLHRVIFYGDHLQDMKHLGVLMGIKVLEEV